jgi:hypothetical protein
MWHSLRGFSLAARPIASVIDQFAKGNDHAAELINHNTGEAASEREERPEHERIVSPSDGPIV